MKTTLDHLSSAQQKELALIRTHICTAGDAVEMVILFGSFARGDWVHDRYVEENTVYEYQSDYDILVVVSGKGLEQNHGVWNRIEQEIRSLPEIRTPVSLIVDTVEFINGKLREGNYFYADIQNEGILMYTTGRYTLPEPSVMSPAERRNAAERDARIWMTRADECFERCSDEVGKGALHWAAFFLHQAVESICAAVMLAQNGYRPKTHDLAKLESMARDIDPRFKNIFPRTKPEDTRLFTLLRKAYVDARYSAEYAITSEELSRLEACARELRRIADVVVAERLAALHELKP